MLGACTGDVLTAGVNEKGPSAYWDQKSHDVRQGDNITMTCTVTGVTVLDVVRLTHYVTDHQNSTAGSSSTTSSLVSDNDAVKEEFVALDRYRVLYHVIDGTATLQLRIRGKRPRHAPVSLGNGMPS